MKKFFFKGYYGHKNLGDDIFVNVADWLGNNFFENVKPLFIGSELPRLSNNSIKFNTKNNFSRRMFELYSSITADEIIYFGGSLFTNGGKNIFDLKYLVRKFPFLQNKTSIFGVSIGPFTHNEDLNDTRSFLEKIKYIGVRDTKSLELSKEMNVSNNVNFTFDNAILLRKIYPQLIKKEIKSQNIKIGISLTRNTSHTGEDLGEELSRENSILRTIEELLKLNPNISELSFIIFNGNEENGDMEVTKNVKKHFSTQIKTSIIDYSSNTEWMLQQIAECDFILGTRLHSGIIAYTFEIPFLLFEYHEKCTEFLNTVNYKARYIIDNPEMNALTINAILKKGGVESVDSPEKFEHIILQKVKNMYKVLSEGN